MYDALGCLMCTMRADPALFEANVEIAAPVSLASNDPQAWKSVSSGFCKNDEVSKRNSPGPPPSLPSDWTTPPDPVSMT
jgi:hypothetical protein